MRGSPLRLPFPFLLTADGNLILPHTIPHVERVQKLLRLRRKGRRTLQVSLRHGQGSSLYTQTRGSVFSFFLHNSGGSSCRVEIESRGLSPAFVAIGHQRPYRAEHFRQIWRIRVPAHPKEVAVSQRVQVEGGRVRPHHLRPLH